MGAKKTSLKGKGGYKVYESLGKYEKNRKRRLERHLKKYPNDETAKKALGNIKYRRYKPHTTGGWINRKDPAFFGIPVGEAMIMAAVKKVASKVSRILATDHAYQKLLADAAIALKNREIKVAASKQRKGKKD